VTDYRPWDILESPAKRELVDAIRAEANPWVWVVEFLKVQP